MPITVGMNVHTRPRGAQDQYAFVSAEKIIEEVVKLGCTSIRVDTGPSSTTVETPSQLDRLSRMMLAARDANVTVQVCFTLPFGINRTDGGAFPDTPAGRYAQGYSLVTDALLSMPYMPIGIEIENEVPIKAGMLYTAGQLVTEYNTPVFEAWADLMRGEYDAIRRRAPGVPIIVGTTNRNYAFIPWIISRGVNPDVVGYHMYQRTGQDLASWQIRTNEPTPILSPNWHAAMMAYGKPISVNELNGHQDEPLSRIGVAGAKTLADVIASPAPIQSIYIYELFEFFDSKHGVGDTYAGQFVRKGAFAPLLNALAPRASGAI
jgi:hypothetical protein